MKPDLSGEPNQMQNRSLVLIGLMGVGKSSIGYRLADAMGAAFMDADREIEAAAGRNIHDIFADFGEAAFRDGERKVIARILAGPPIVLATGGGAFLNQKTRDIIAKQGISIWLRASLDELVRRTEQCTRRPLLQGENRRQTLSKLMEQRHHIYAKADLVVDTDQGSLDDTLIRIQSAIQRFMEQQK